MSSSLFGQGQFGAEVFGQLTDEYFEEYLNDYVDCIPPWLRPEESREFLKQFFYYAALDLATKNKTLDDLHYYINPRTSPEPWLDWMIAEWWGWTLIPEGYPLDPLGAEITSSPCKRRLLFNLHRHYKRRYTPQGIKELLEEFGVIADVYDGPIYYGGYYGSYGSRHPLAGRIRVLGFEPIEFPRRTFYGGYYGGTFYHSSRQIVTREFVESLVHWSRPAGVKIMIEWVAPPTDTRATRSIPDDDSIILPFAS
jgi:hypothetical protein